MKEQVFGNLAAALQAMDSDSRRGRGKSKVKIHDGESIGDDAQYTKTDAQMAPDRSSAPIVDDANTDDYITQLEAQGEQLMPESKGVVDSATSLVSSVSPEAATTLKAKFDALTPDQKVAAGIGLYIGGKAALSMVPTKYLLAAGALYVWNQMQKQKQAASSTAATTTPVAGLG